MQEIFKFISDKQKYHNIKSFLRCPNTWNEMATEIIFEHYTRSLLIKTKSDVIYSERNT